MGEKEDAETAHRCLQFLCFLRAWESSWQPFHTDRSTTAHSAKGSEIHQNSRLQMEDLLQQQTGRSWKETPEKEEGTLWWGEVRLRKRAADRCPVKPASSILLSGDFICLLWPHPHHVNHCALLTEWIILQLSIIYWETLCFGCFWFKEGLATEVTERNGYHNPSHDRMINDTTALTSSS